MHLFLCALAVCAALMAAPSQVKFPDRPLVIFNGDFPDPTVVRDGEDYYLTYSAFDAVPGMLIWHSRDLQNWKPVARALRKQVGTIWAPDMVKHNGLFYIYFPSLGTNWAITAKNPRGPWSEPVDLKVKGIDPGHIAGPDGKRYLHVSGGRAVELAADGLSTAGELRKVYEGWKFPDDWVVECFCLESPKLSFRKGYYYLTSAQGGTGGPATSHMAVTARSKHPMGPWEENPYNPVVRTWSPAETWWSKGHGTLVEAPGGRSYIIYHAYEKGHLNMGRHILLDPVTWTADGWVKGLSKEAGAAPRAAIRNHQIQSDDFAKPDLHLQWQFSGLGSVADFQSGPGGLRFRASDKMKVLHTQSGDPRYEATIEAASDPGVETGLVVYYNNDFISGISVSAGKIQAVRRGKPHGPPIPCPDCRYLRIRLVDDQLSTFYSVDGEKWLKHPNSTEVSGYQHNVLTGFYSIRLGIFARGTGEARVRRFGYRKLQ